MPKTIQQTVKFQASAGRLFDMYLSPAGHAAFTGKPVTIGQTPGARFEAFGGMIWGQILQVIPNRLIVQSWRSKHFFDEDLDSTLILAFYEEGPNSARIEMVHANVADQDAEAVAEGWSQHYWNPWRKYLKT